MLILAVTVSTSWLVIFAAAGFTLGFLGGRWIVRYQLNDPRIPRIFLRKREPSAPPAVYEAPEESTRVG